MADIAIETMEGDPGDSLDITASFSGWASRGQTPIQAGLHENLDFLDFLSATADLYSHPGVLEMQMRIDTGTTLGSGAVSHVSSISAAFTRPSELSLNQFHYRELVIVKRAAKRLFNSEPPSINTRTLHEMISELRILSHPPLREHPNIVKLIGVHWDSLFPVGIVTYNKTFYNIQLTQKNHI